MQYFYVNTTLAYGIDSDQGIKTNIRSLQNIKVYPSKNDLLEFLAQNVLKACRDVFQNLIACL